MWNRFIRRISWSYSDEQFFLGCLTLAGVLVLGFAVLVFNLVAIPLGIEYLWNALFPDRSITYIHALIFYVGFVVLFSMAMAKRDD